MPGLGGWCAWSGGVWSRRGGVPGLGVVPCPGGWCAWSGGCAWAGGGGGGLPQCLVGYHHSPPPCEQNDKQVQKYYLGHNFVAAGKNITLPQLLLRTVKIFFSRRHDVQFFPDEPTRCDPYTVTTPTCTEYEIQSVIMPNMFGAPNQAYTDKLMAYIANTVSTVLSVYQHV